MNIVSSTGRGARLMGYGLVFFGAVSLAACSSVGQTVCTEIGAPTGVGITVDATIAEQVSDELVVEVAWGDEVVEANVLLYPSTSAVDDGCSGDEPDASCSATVQPTGGKSGFADVNELPEASVDVTVHLRDTNGEPLPPHESRVVAEATYPNGPDCPAGGVQAYVTVS